MSLELILTLLAPVVAAYLSQIAKKWGWNLPGLGPKPPVDPAKPDPLADRPVLSMLFKLLQAQMKGPQAPPAAEPPSAPLFENGPEPGPAPGLAQSTHQTVESEVPLKIRVQATIIP